MTASTTTVIPQPPSWRARYLAALKGAPLPPAVKVFTPAAAAAGNSAPATASKPRRMTYSPFNWYWKDDTGRIFSSASQSVIPATDPTYTAWLAAGNAPTPWPRDKVSGQTPEALDAVLSPYGLATGLTMAPFSDLQAKAKLLASQCCAAIIKQVMPDAAHQVAFQNAASLVNGSGGVAPNSGPMVAKFAGLASVHGMTATQFAALVIVMQGASLDLATALATLNATVDSAKAVADLASASASFHIAISAVEAEISAAR